jgi:glycosyltransferase involved in cell wall biosynthesis
MNILFVSEHAVHIGGIGAVIHQLCLGLQQLGHRCYLYTSQPVPAQYDDELLFDGIATGPLAAPARISDLRQQRANRQAFRAFSAAMQQWQIDLVHCHEIHRSLYTAGRASLRPIVASSHGGVFHQRYKKSRVIAAYRRFVDKVSCITVLNSAMADTLQQRFGALFKVVTIANGIEDSWLVDEPQQHKDILLCAGRLSADKCYDLAIDAYAASSSRQRYALVIAGEGDTRADLEARATQHQIPIIRGLPATAAATNTLYFTGYQTGSSKKALFARARLFLHPSRFEAFGIVLLEAMAQGALPLCADLATYRSQFPAQDFHLCYVAQFAAVDWAKAIDDSAGLPTLATLSRDNHRAVSCFAWGHIFQRYLDCYQAAIADNRPDALQ